MKLDINCADNEKCGLQQERRKSPSLLSSLPQAIYGRIQADYNKINLNPPIVQGYVSRIGEISVVRATITTAFPIPFSIPVPADVRLLTWMIVPPAGSLPPCWVLFVCSHSVERECAESYFVDSLFGLIRIDVYDAQRSEVLPVKEEPDAARALLHAVCAANIGIVQSALEEIGFGLADVLSKAQTVSYHDQENGALLLAGILNPLPRYALFRQGSRLTLAPIREVSMTFANDIQTEIAFDYRPPGLNKPLALVGSNSIYGLREHD